MDIRLDDLLKSTQSGTLNTDSGASLSQKETKRTLTPEERTEIDRIKNSIDFTDTQKILQYGTGAQQQIADFSTQVLSQVRTKDSGMVGELLGNLVTQVKTAEKGDGGLLNRLPFFGSAVRKAKAMKRSYDKVSVQVERVQQSLEACKGKMMQDVATFDSLYNENYKYFRALELYICAGEEKLTELRETTIPKLQQEAAASSDPMAAQAVADFISRVNRFEKQIYDLKTSRTIAIQTAPQIRLVQNNDKVLIDRVQTAIYSTIPLWKNQMVIALGLANQEQVLKVQRAVTDTTNELLKRNAQLLKQNSIDVARENERGIVDIATIQQVSEALIQTVSETLRIQEEGKQKRKEAEQQLAAIEARLREAVLQGSQRHT